MSKLHLVFESMNPQQPNYQQGYNFEMFRIWKLVEDDGYNYRDQEPRHFKQTGVMDSYGETSWHSDDMIEVTPVDKIHKVYEYEEV